ncbi:histidine kinase [Tellurirhabdus rosea]|uniref:histidine kinase n=1 Tax=Tellurirhabdus rosea TaxID=2674997 RepID=UPI0022519B00|nr:histidine kinase [Tellurirhabdus rosea]
MGYDYWLMLFLGTVWAMLLLNVVQWWLYRERVYGLYTVYMLVWLGYFLLRIADLDEGVDTFVRVAFPMLAYVVYFDLTTDFLNLRVRNQRLLRIFRRTQGAMLAYTVFEAIYCIWIPGQLKPAHELVHTLARTGLAVQSVYIIALVYRWKDMVSRFFITGSSALVLGALSAMILSFVLPTPYAEAFWAKPLTYMQVGIMLELLFFSLGLTYRHRRQEVRQAVRKALVEKELAREREQRQREHLEAELAVQQLRQEKTEVQMRALQTQINPHFLFNSLNTLSSLIEESPNQASEFVDELSSVYRYLLRSNDTELTSLGVELSFIHSYFNLLKTRHGNSLRSEVSVPAEFEHTLLPPLTLQLLVENAVKHNIALPDQPLLIRIRIAEAGKLVVENTLQRKMLRVESNGVGLSNIASKYRLLGSALPMFEERDGWFRVTLPLLGVSRPSPVLK